MADDCTCGRCGRVADSSEFVLGLEGVEGGEPPPLHVCLGCVTYEEMRRFNTNRRLRGLAELPVRAWAELPAI
jgi:hypothetical protein